MDQFKQRLGQTILSMNEDILQLQKYYRNLKELDEDNSWTESLKRSTNEKEKTVMENRDTLEAAFKYLVENPGLMDEKKMKKYIQFTKTTIESAEKCLAMKNDIDENIEKVADKTLHC